MFHGSSAVEDAFDLAQKGSAVIPSEIQRAATQWHRVDIVQFDNIIFPGSSAVERLAVNEKVAGSIPARGAR